MNWFRTAFVSLNLSSRNRSSVNMTSRLIDKVVPATSSGGPVSRLIGSVDIDGKGTSHALPEVDPFILLDLAQLNQHNRPPFGAHPHRGHSVVTLLLQGQMQSWDSFSNQHTTIKGPASYWVDAGTGVFHDETSVIVDESDPAQHIKLLQLWVGVKEADRQKPARLQYDTDLPTTDLLDCETSRKAGTVTHYVGEKTTIETPHPLVVFHVQQNANTSVDLSIDPSHGGFIVMLSADDAAATVQFGGTTSPLKQHDVLVLANDVSTSSTVKATTGDHSAEYMVCAGAKHGEAWVKKLVANGAIICATTEQAQDVAPKVEAYAAAGKVEGGSFAPFGS
jgi:redox-sensitive bicupin YhaK (pirin superfamily)